MLETAGWYQSLDSMPTSRQRPQADFHSPVGDRQKAQNRGEQLCHAIVVSCHVLYLTHLCFMENLKALILLDFFL